MKEIENSNYNQRMPKAIKQLNIKHKTPPPPYTNFQLTSYYKEKFNKSTTATQQKQENQTHINVKITNSEVNSAIKSLENNRSPGYDNIVAEMMNILSSTTIDKLTHIINTTINNKQPHQLGLGVLLPIPKHNKTKKVENTRPIILLSTIRKIISLITLNRLRPTIENYLSPSQAAYRKGRSIEDIVWTLKLEIASTLSTNNKITIHGIDLSSAFDSVNRVKMMEILHTICSKEDMKLIHFLLNETSLRVRTKEVGPTFDTNISIPQGDGLSPVLFTTYLEAALREVRNNVHAQDIAYADDVDFISKDGVNLNIVEKILEKWSLKMNSTITETLKIGSGNEWKNAKKLGMLLDTKQGWKRRKQLTTTAMLKLKKIWNSSITRNKKLRIYKAYVQSIMLFGCSTWAMDKGMVRSVDSFNRKMVQYVCGVFWPNRMKTETVNALIEPASQIVTRRRWQMLGHILRMDDLVPAKRSTINCLKKKKRKAWKT